MSGYSVNILFGHFGPLPLEPMPSLPHPPPHGYTRLPGAWGPTDALPQPWSFQAGAIRIICHLIRVPRAAVVQATPAGTQWSRAGDWAGARLGLRTTSCIQLTKADTCVYTSGVLGSPHQSPEKETRPCARFLHTRGPPESAWGWRERQGQGSISGPLSLASLPRNPSKAS